MPGQHVQRPWGRNGASMFGGQKKASQCGWSRVGWGRALGGGVRGMRDPVGQDLSGTLTPNVNKRGSRETVGN